MNKGDAKQRRLANIIDVSFVKCGGMTTYGSRLPQHTMLHRE